MQKFIIGNWKMNGLQSDLAIVDEIAEIAQTYEDVHTGLCLPATLMALAARANPAFLIGGQDCHYRESGAHTGCVSAPMLADSGAKLVILGHSERRGDQNETDADVLAKTQAAITAKLRPIVCVGETLAQREAGQAQDVVLAQIDGSLPDRIAGSGICVAYEPVWAIGTGRIPSVEDVSSMHAAIRDRLVARYGASGSTVAILYGGSMNGENAESLLSVANVDGGLIGGASLSAAKFEPIVKAASMSMGQ
jgi:triosephosphate isomerase (TIM)